MLLQTERDVWDVWDIEEKSGSKYLAFLDFQESLLFY